MKIPSQLLNLQCGMIGTQAVIKRRLSDLAGVFADENAYTLALEAGNPLVYQVSSLEPGSGPGDLHYGLGRIEPGRVGDEYFLTKGHLHTWREAAEVYLGLAGKGLVLMEDERSGEAWWEPLEKNMVVYVPGYTAHRTVNVGTEPLVYLGIYPAQAGHDYSSIASRNFRYVVIATPTGPKVLERIRPGGNYV